MSCKFQGRRKYRMMGTKGLDGPFSTCGWFIGNSGGGSADGIAGMWTDGLDCTGGGTLAIRADSTPTTGPLSWTDASGITVTKNGTIFATSVTINPASTSPSLEVLLDVVFDQPISAYDIIQLHYDEGQGNFSNASGPLQTSDTLVTNCIAAGDVVFTARATTLDLVASNTVTLTGGSFAVDWGDGQYVDYAGPTASGVASGVMKIVSANPITNIQFTTDTFTQVEFIATYTLTSAVDMFNGNTNLIVFSSDARTVNNITDYTNTFLNCSGLTDMPSLNTALGTNFTSTFQGCTGLTEFPLLDLTGGTNFTSTFEGCTGFTKFPFIDTSAGLTFDRMFANASNLVCLTELNTLNQTSTADLFLGATSLLNPDTVDQTALLAGAHYINPGSCPNLAPSVPQNLAGEAVSPTFINVTWDNSTDPEGDLLFYRLYRDAVVVYDGPQTNYSDTGLTSNTSYAYTVDAYDEYGAESAQSPAVNVSTHAIVPGTPTNLTAVPNTTTPTEAVDVAWATGTDPDGVLTGYRLYRDGNQVYVGTALTFTDTGLASNTSYAYTVLAYADGVGESSQSAPTNVTTDANIPSTPTSLSAVVNPANPETEVDVAWLASSDPDNVLTGYRVYRDAVQVYEGPLLAITDTGLIKDTTYSYTVSAYATAGESAQSEPVEVTTDAGFSATGGVVTDDAGFRYHTFLSSADLVVTGDGAVEYLIVAGGGGGGFTDATNYPGGGGAGGYQALSATLNTGTFPVVVGEGGDTNVNGSNSTFNSITSLGGGRGGGFSNLHGSVGGSGGGGRALNGTGAAGTLGQGFAGGDGGATSIINGGGGGAGGNGIQDAGGPGTIWLDGNTYAAGGTSFEGEPIQNTGNGGNMWTTSNGKVGASGIVIIRYPI